MNINYNTLLKISLPYVYILVFVYAICSVLFLFLPKNSVEITNINEAQLKYVNFDGFYSNAQTTKYEVKSKIKNKEIASLSTFKLKAIYSTASYGGWIVLDTSSKNSVILSQDEQINGYVLFRLFKHYVIFKKDSKEYKLELPKEKDVNYEIQNEESNENIIVESGSVTVKREYLKTYVNDINKIWKSIVISDIRKDGDLDGFRVDKIEKDSVFEKLGLEKGDIIKSVNGNKIKSYADAFKIYNGINEMDYLTLGILRNNEIVELDYEIN